MSRRFLHQSLLPLLLGASSLALAQTTPEPVTPRPSDTHVIRTRGNRAMRRTMQAWEAGFRSQHPEVTFEDTLLGSATGMAGITTGASDLTLLGRPVTPNEVIGFEWVHRVKPLGIAVARGSLDAENHSPALAVLVSRRNPVTSISMQQLAQILGCPAYTTQPVTWSLAGAGGTWSKHPVHAYLYDDQTGTGALLMQTVQGTKDCWNWQIVREFSDIDNNDRTVHTASQQIAEALEKDPDGLAITTLAELDSRVKALPIAKDGGAPIALTAAAVTDGSYPLARNVYIYLLRPKDKPVDPLLAEFLRFILSPEGQTIAAKAGDFLPLSTAAANAELDKLK